MIKTLRITSVAAVLLAAVVLASVLGFLRPDSLIGLNFGVRSDKQTDKILSGPSAVDRFKEKYGNKVPSGADTTPPLVKQAELFANIINPLALDGTPALVSPTNLPPRPTLPIRPPSVSGKLELLGTCCSSNPTASLAWIRLPDNNQQWVRVGSEIGHVTIKEIRKGAIVYWDGSKDVELPALAAPETSTLLETGKAPKDAASLKSQVSSEPPASGRGPNAKPQAANSANPPTSPVKPSVVPNRAAAVGTPSPSAQISKEEQENLSQLGNRLKAGAGVDPNALISQFKSSLSHPPQPGSVPNPVAEVNANRTAWKDSMKEDARRQWQKRLAAPRTTKK